MLVVYFLLVVGLVLLVTLIPLPKKRNIKKYSKPENIIKNLTEKLVNNPKISKFKLNKNTNKYRRETKKLRKAGIRFTLEQLLVVRVIVVVIAFFVIINYYNNIHEMKEKEIINSAKPKTVGINFGLGGNQNTQTDRSPNTAKVDKGQTNQFGMETMQQLYLSTAFKEIPEYKEYFKNNQLQELVNKLSHIREELDIDDKENEQIKKVMSTMNMAYDVSRFSTQDYLTIFLISVLSSALVDAYISVKYKYRKRLIAKELDRMEAIATLLLGKDSINVAFMLKQMKKRSKILKNDITKCLNSYNGNPEKALNTLIEDVDEPDFSKFMVILKECLVSDKETNKEIIKIQRRLRLVAQETHNKQVNKEKAVKLTLIQLPLMTCTALMFLYPILKILQKSL